MARSELYICLAAYLVPAHSLGYLEAGPTEGHVKPIYSAAIVPLGSADPSHHSHSSLSPLLALVWWPLHSP